MPAVTAISLVNQEDDKEVVAENLDLVWLRGCMRASEEVEEATSQSLTIQVHAEAGLPLVSISRAD